MVGILWNDLWDIIKRDGILKKKSVKDGLRILIEVVFSSS